MMANSSLSVSSLDFDTLKNNLKTYLQSQSVFRDYDFEGSNMNVLLSLLSYNSYLNSFYLNMVAAESFIDTAQIRDSVISHAKLLNYTPNSKRSAEAVVNIIFSTTGINQIFTIPKGTQFSGTNANGSYVYLTDREYTLNSGNSTFLAENIKIYEGSYITESFVKNDAEENQKFILANESIDTDSILVTVFENDNLNGIDYKLAESLYGVTDTSKVYFLQAYKNQYEIVFGDNVFGKTPVNGSTIVVNYRITNGTDGSGISSFILDDNLGSYNNGQATPIVITTQSGSGSANSESIETIRFRAPRAYQTQNRAITSEDYKTLIVSNFTDIKTLHTYTGEISNLGKVIISPITYSGNYLSDTRKLELIDFITEKMSIGLTPIIVNPEILYLSPKISIKYDPKKTNSVSNIIQQKIILAVEKYNNLYLKDFNISYVKSDFTDYLMQVDPGIISVNVDTYLKVVISPKIYNKVSLTPSFNNRIIPTNVNSNSFLLSDGVVYKFTDYNPNLTVLTTQKNDSGVSIISSTTKKLYLASQNTFKTNYIEIGTIDYETGTFYIYDLTVADYLSGNGIEITGAPFNNDIYVKKNQVIEIDLSTTEVTVSNI